MSNIHKYLPKVLQPILEFQLINQDLDIELSLLDKYITDINKETIVQTATDYGISKWENALGIIPGDTDSLEVRRFRVNNILTSKLPYTIRWLRQKLTEITGSATGWTLNMNYQDYTATIILSGLDTDLMLEVEKQLRNAIPANIELEIGGPSIAGGNIKVGIAMNYGTKYLIPTAGQSGEVVIPLGKNKLPNFMTSMEESGVSFTVNSDKSISCYGTAEQRVEPRLCRKQFILAPGTYKYTGELLLVMPKKSGGYLSVQPGGTFTLNSMERLLSAYFRVENGQQLNLTYHPQLIISGSDESYEPFIGI